jgi:carboxyl-terminal processing protease
MLLNEAVDMIQGDPGQKITLTVLHEGSKEPVDVSLTRDIIQVQSVLGDQRKADDPEQWDFMLDKRSKIGYLRLTNFSEKAAKEVRQVVEDLQRQGARGLIIDLRYNPGGLLRAAVEIADLFIPEGRIVSTKGRNQKEEIYDAKPDGKLMMPADKFPMAVLVNRFSASASEILAAALQDHNRAIVVGERTYGKGSVQNVIMMEKDTSALKLTTASYWRPSGKNIHRFPDSKETDEWGVKPNPGFEVPLKDEDRIEYFNYRNERDVVRTKKPEKKDGDDKEKKEKKPFVDRVLEKAVEHLKQEIDKQNAAAPREIKEA